jgi:hypothetical protein
MLKIPAFQPEDRFFLGDLPDSCGSPLSATSVAIVIIPNLTGMFNEKRTIFEIFRERVNECMRKSGVIVGTSYDDWNCEFWFIELVLFFLRRDFCRCFCIS